MKITLKLNKTINENANIFFDKAKKLKKKLPGLLSAIDQTNLEIKKLESQKDDYLKKKEKHEKLKIHIKEEWYHKFRWTKTTNDLLCVFGKDSSTNEILIKKHMKDTDLVFHTEEPGSPFGLIINGQNLATDIDKFECAQYLACFSKQWKLAYGEADVFWVMPDQISKKAESGEYLAKGSFMVRGKKNILKKIPLLIGIGFIQKQIEDIKYTEVFSGSVDACKKFCGANKFVKIEPGKMTYKKLNSEIKKKLKHTVDELPKYIPNNGRVLKK